MQEYYDKFYDKIKLTLNKGDFCIDKKNKSQIRELIKIDTNKTK